MMQHLISKILELHYLSYKKEDTFGKQRMKIMWSLFGDVTSKVLYSKLEKGPLVKPSCIFKMMMDNVYLVWRILAKLFSHLYKMFFKQTTLKLL